METDEPLETGYGPDTPPGDNACNDFNRSLVAAYGGLARARGDRVVEDADLLLSDGGSPTVFGNVVVVRRPLTGDGWRSAADRMGDFYAENAGGDFLLFSAWPTPDLGPLDFGRIGHPPLMLRPAGPVDVQPVAGLEIKAVEDESTAADCEWALVEGFPIPELLPFRRGALFPAGAGPLEGWHHWVAYLDGEPVGTSSAYVDGDHVHVEFVATVEAARGRGIGRALTATATATAAALPAMLIASDAGRPIYERLGYRSILRYSLWAGHRR